VMVEKRSIRSQLFGLHADLALRLPPVNLYKAK